MPPDISGGGLAAVGQSERPAMAGARVRKASHVILFCDTPAPGRCQEQIAKLPMQSDCYGHWPAVAGIHGRADVLDLRADGGMGSIHPSGI